MLGIGRRGPGACDQHSPKNEHAGAAERTANSVSQLKNRVRTMNKLKLHDERNNHSLGRSWIRLGVVSDTHAYEDEEPGGVPNAKRDVRPFLSQMILTVTIIL